MFWWKVVGYTLGAAAIVGAGIGAHKLGLFDKSTEKEENIDNNGGEVVGYSDGGETVVISYPPSSDQTSDSSSDIEEIEDTSQTELITVDEGSESDGSPESPNNAEDISNTTLTIVEDSGGDGSNGTSDSTK